jgi:hypothetical protein
MSDLLNSASLVLIPSGYKEDTVYSVVPSDGSGDLSFTRASNGTRVNSAGLVEVCPWNLLEQSETFDNAYWTKLDATVTTNSTTAPNGTTTADTITADAGGSFPRILSTLVIEDNAIVTQTTYVKANTANSCRIISILKNGSTASGAVFNLTNGAVSNLENVISAIATEVGNGWYRCAISFNVGTGGSSITCRAVSHNVSTIGGNEFTDGRSLFIWGAQLNVGSTAKPYFPTTDRLNVPRLTYQNGGGGCPSLLLEKQSTNLFAYSEDFTNGVWTLGGLGITANNTTSPDGTQNAEKFTEDSSNGNHLFYNTNAVTSAATTSVSIFYKKGTRRYFSIKLQIGTSSYTQVFDADGLTTGSNSSNGLTSVSTSIVSMGNGWVRASVTGTDPSASTSCYIICSLSNSATPSFDPSNYNPTYQGTGTDNGFFWGAQLEASSYPTSYIPTTSASATRVADACFKTGISSLIGQTEGVLFADVNWVVKPEDGSPVIGIVTLNNNVANLNNCIILGIERASGGANRVYCLIQNSGATVGELSGSSISNGRYKIALAYKANDFVLYVNGVQIATDTSGTPPTTNELLLGLRFQGDSYNLNDTINEAVVFKTRLTNAELASLTTI